MKFSIPTLFLVLLFAVLAQAQETATKEESATSSADDPLISDELDLDQLLQDETAVPDDEPAEESIESEPEQTTDSTSESQSTAEAQDKEEETSAQQQPVQQSGPLVDLLGQKLYSLEMVDETHAQIVPHYTNEALKGKKVIGLYFSADWCGPCRQFTPELVQFYDKMNNRRGHKDDFEIVWVSRCRDMESYGQYFTHMTWLALPPEEAMGERGQMLNNKYKIKSIPTLVLLDDLGNLITTDARNKIPNDKAGVGFPWRNPLVTLYTTIFPRSLRLMVKGQVDSVKGKFVQRLKGLVGMKTTAS